MASILIIDDDVTLLTRLAAQLEAAGYQVARSSDVVHGERLYVEQRPDLVVLEVRAGDGRGWDLLERFSAETPVLVLSGAAREEDVVRGFEAGAIDYVSKPYRSAELLARLRVRLSDAAPSPLAARAVMSPAPAPVVTTAAPAAPTPVVAAAAPAASEPRPASGAPAPQAASKRQHARRGSDIDETVFMSEAEEMALLRMPPATGTQAGPSVDRIIEEGSGSFGPRLRAERLRRHLTLVQVENDLRIRMSYLQAIEDEKYTLLPRGPAALEMVRRYAEHLGLDAADMLAEFRSKHYVEAPEPIPALGGPPAPRSLPRWPIALAAILLALLVGLGTILVLDPGFFSRVPVFLQGLWTQILGGMGG